MAARNKDPPAGEILNDLRRQQKSMEEDMRRLQIDLEVALTPVSKAEVASAVDASPLPTTPMVNKSNVSAARPTPVNITSPLRITALAGAPDASGVMDASTVSPPPQSPSKLPAGLKAALKQRSERGAAVRGAVADISLSRIPQAASMYVSDGGGASRDPRTSPRRQPRRGEAPAMASPGVGGALPASWRSSVRTGTALGNDSTDALGPAVFTTPVTTAGGSMVAGAGGGVGAVSPIASLQTVPRHSAEPRSPYGGLFQGSPRGRSPTASPRGGGGYSGGFVDQPSTSTATTLPPSGVPVPLSGGARPGPTDPDALWAHPSVAAAQMDAADFTQYELPSQRAARRGRKRWDISTATPTFSAFKNPEAVRPPPLFTGHRPKSHEEPAPTSPFSPGGGFVYHPQSPALATPKTPGTAGGAKPRVSFGQATVTPGSAARRPVRKRSVSARAGARPRPGGPNQRGSVRSRTPDMDLLSRPEKFFDPLIMATGDLVSQGHLAMDSNKGRVVPAPNSRNPLMGEIKPVLTKEGLWATVPHTMRMISKGCGIMR